MHQTVKGNWHLLMAISALAMGTTACSGAVDRSSSANVGATSEAIIGGQPASDYPETADIQLLQGGQLVAWCSGTVIAPQVVLTAGHCVNGADRWQITMPYSGGQSATASTGTTNYAPLDPNSEAVNPNAYDVGLLFLDSAIALDSYPTLATSPITDGSLVRNLGRIKQGQVTDRFFVSDPISVKDATNDGFPYDYIATTEIESGDSGGPVVADGTHQIVAVNSAADDSTEVLARVDLVQDWISTQMANHSQQ